MFYVQILSTLFSLCCLLFNEGDSHILCRGLTQANFVLDDKRAIAFNGLLMSEEAIQDHSYMKVVVIDDDAMILKALKAALKDFGFEVLTYQNPQEGLAWIRDHGVDIVICDIYMPECDGFQVLKQVKDTDPQCDFIFMTAHSHVDIAIRALREGATDFFEKPFDLSSLRAAMERTRRFRMLRQEKELLTSQVHTLSDENRPHSRRHGVMLGQSAPMKQIAEKIVDLAATTATALIQGESGTGKELTAHAIHQSSPRRDKLFLTVNCPSIPEDLFESEMFGHRRGSFTGAVETRGGYLKAAEGGTLFLDEIGDLPLKSQAKILRLLEQKTFLPIGEHKELSTDVRIVAATNQDLQALVEKKRFRQDLYYRLNVCVIRQPPLRERKEDIPLLALYFALQFAAEMGKLIDGIEDTALNMLCAYDYPGNVRELRNIVESSVIHCRHEGVLTDDDLPKSFVPSAGHSDPDAGWTMESIRFEDVEKTLYREALSRSGNNVSAAARLLGLSRGKLRRRMGDLNIEP